MKRLLLVGAVLGLVLAACGSSASDIDGTSWVLFAYDDGGGRVDVLANTEVTIAFDGDQVSGSDGCNNFSGNYETGSGNKITIGPLASTRMACEPDVMAQADVVFRLVSDAFLYEKVDGQFFMRTEDARFLGYDGA